MPNQRALVLPKPQAELVIDASVPIPEPGKNEILIKVKSAALNPGDSFIKKFGVPETSVKYPLILGFDFAGEVVELGEGVANFKVGDRVCVPSI